MRVAVRGVFLLLAASAVAQQSAAALLDARRITNGEFATQRFGPVRWIDGAHFATLVPNPQRKALELLSYDASTGKSEGLIGAHSLRVSGYEQPLQIEDYALSPKGGEYLVYCDSQRVWRQNTRGEYFLVRPESAAQASRVGGNLPKSSLMFAKYSPDGSKVAFVSGNNLYVQDSWNGEPKALTADGSRTIINGTFDWVYEEEFDCRDGFRWSPDSKSIAYWQLDCSGVGEFLMMDNLSDRYSKPIPLQYPKAGTTNSSCRIGVVSVEGGSTTWMKTPGDPRNTYLPRMEWHPDGKELMVQWLPRQQNRLDVLACDAKTGEVRTVWTERDEAYVDVREDFRWLQQGAAFFWTGDSDGFRHIRAVPWRGGDAKLLTPGDYDVMAVEYSDVDRGVLYIAGSDGNATQRYLFSVQDGKATRLSPKDQPGTHTYQISGDGSMAIHTYSSFDHPPVIDLVKLPSHERVRVLVDNADLRERYGKVSKGKNEFFQVTTADGVTLDGFAMYPPDFDASKSWPVLFHVYGEPWSQTVLDSWTINHHLFHRMVTQQGYVVMSVDARGTPAPKGRAWRKALYQKIGITSSHDWDQAVAALCQQRSWMDAKRLAIWGWSGGGAMTLNMLFRYPGRFAAGMSVAPVTDISLYDTIYQERYCGIPQDVPEVYKNCSPITFAKQLQSPLLLVHGTGDDNVHFQNSERLFDELVAQGKKFEYLAYPNRSHSIHEGRGTRAHLYDALADFLHRRILAGPR
jgi:dipeptidyl-peptidase-4